MNGEPRDAPHILGAEWEKENVMTYDGGSQPCRLSLSHENHFDATEEVAHALNVEPDR